MISAEQKTKPFVLKDVFGKGLNTISHEPWIKRHSLTKED